MDDDFPIDKIRNIGFIAHIDAGKTTVTERVLFVSGRIHRVGGVDEGTTTMDWMPQERERGITITSAATTVPWQDCRVNVIDTPGHVDFTAEVERSLRVLDGGIVVLDAVAGVQSQSETVWRQADTYKVPRICFVNKMDRVGASFPRTIESIRRRLKGNPVPVQLPLGEEAAFLGVIDLLGSQALVYPSGRDTGSEVVPPVSQPIPAEYQKSFQEYRQAMIEKNVETDEKLLIRYLEGEEISEQDLRQALRRATIQRKVVPVLCGSAIQGKGIHRPDGKAGLAVGPGRSVRSSRRRLPPAPGRHAGGRPGRPVPGNLRSGARSRIGRNHDHAHAVPRGGPGAVGAGRRGS